MAMKVPQGYKLAITLDEESYHLLKTLSEDMGLSDAKTAKVLLLQTLKQSKKWEVAIEAVQNEQMVLKETKKRKISV